MSHAKAVCTLILGVLAIATYWGIALAKGKKVKLQDILMAGLIVAAVVPGGFYLAGASAALIHHEETQEVAVMGGLAGFAIMLVTVSKAIDMFKAIWKAKKKKTEGPEDDSESGSIIPPTT
jgi:hypothetical protein